jgi:hypothetical protein
MAQATDRTGPPQAATYGGCPCNVGLPVQPTRLTIPSRFANLREPGSTGYVPGATQVTIPSRFANFREPGSTGSVPAAASVTTVTTSGGLDWLSALIGAGAAFGVALAVAGGMTARRKRRALAHT